MLGIQTRQAYGALSHWVAAQQRRGVRVLGICGAQGSGKSTLADFLAGQLQRDHGLKVVAVSLDDFYLGRAARAKLAQDIHPLLATRGVPGTHDAARGLASLQSLKAGKDCALPRFSKATDDCLDAHHERHVSGRQDLVIFEGWCVGVPPQDPKALALPVNALERDEDPDGRWRTYVNEQLAGPYAQWFGAIDATVFLQVPGWDAVRRWRAQQETETAAASGGTSAYSDPVALERFLSHYERITRHALAVMPARADRLVTLDDAHEARLVPEDL